MKRYATALFLTAALTVGCSPPLEINGQVFIDTAGSATKVAQVEIYVVSEEALVNNLKSSLTTIRAEYDRLQAVHQVNSRHLASKVALARQAQLNAIESAKLQLIAIESGILLPCPIFSPDCNAQRASTTNDIIETSHNARTNARKKFEESEAALTGLANGSNADFFLPIAIQGASVAAMSDADGEFKLSLEAGKRVAIIGKKDKLVWLIWMTPKKGDQIFLTNKNLNGTQCDACVFNKSELESTMAFIPAAISSAQTKQLEVTNE